MKKIMLSLSLLLNIQLIAIAQNSYSRWNGKKWEQLSGSGKMLQLNPAVTSFSNIEVSNMNVKVKVETGAAAYSVNVFIDDNLKEFFRFKQEGNSLKLSMDYSGGKYPRWLSDNHTVVTVKTPALETLTNKGNSKVEIKLHGQPAFALLSDGNPDIKLTGKIATLQIVSTGNSDIHAAQLIADKIILSSNGNTAIEVKTKILVEKDVKGNNDISNQFYKPTNKLANKEDYYRGSAEPISFQLKNNSLMPTKVTIISYRQDVKGNGTTGYFLGPYGSKTYRFPEGTKIYIANNEQVNTVMSGAKISDQLPFLIVKKEDDGKSFNLK